ncbi:hypothetical protein HHI36_003595 [Cryptolaemus montrouzieri]|uniref:Gustatory receptor n=1 Tax=Cryptolaemus montrouzieri TaxID=559131 RepID=A0ABD2PDU6_9CUCU
MVFDNRSCMIKFILLTNILLILPPLSDKIRFYKCYTLIAAICLTAVFVCSSIGRYNMIYATVELEPILSILDQVSQTLLHVSNLVSSTWLTYFSQTSYQEFTKKLARISKILNLPWLKLKSLYKLFMVFVIFVCAAIGYDAYIWISTLGMECFKLYALKGIQFFQCSLNAFMMYSFSLHIKNLFKEINNQIALQVEKDFRRKQHFPLRKTIAPIIALERNKLKYFISVHNEICDLVDDFNSIFGFNVVLIVFNSMLNILFNSGLIAVYASKDSTALKGVHYGIDLTISRFQWITVSLVSRMLGVT